MSVCAVQREVEESCALSGLWLSSDRLKTTAALSPHADRQHTITQTRLSRPPTP